VSNNAAAEPRLSPGGGKVARRDETGSVREAAAASLTESKWSATRSITVLLLGAEPGGRESLPGATKPAVSSIESSKEEGKAADALAPVRGIVPGGAASLLCLLSLRFGPNHVRITTRLLNLGRL